MSKDIYAITDIEGYAYEMRNAAAKSICKNTDENLDSYITIEQMINLINEECLGFDDEKRPLLNEITNEQIYESTIVWINNIGLAKLAAQGLVECAWDDISNEMIFWIDKEIPNEQLNYDKTRNNIKDQRS